MSVPTFSSGTYPYQISHPIRIGGASTAGFLDLLPVRSNLYVPELSACAFALTIKSAQEFFLRHYQRLHNHNRDLLRLLRKLWCQQQH